MFACSDSPVIPRSSRLRIQRAAFSLVEVALALGVFVFVMVALVGLLPIGARSGRDGRSETLALNVLDAVVSDLKVAPAGGASPRYGIGLAITPGESSQGTFLLDETGSPANANATGEEGDRLAAFEVSYKISKPLQPEVPLLVRLRARWPFAAPASSGEFREILVAIPGH